jgi:tetratricopeptide (TPR) repeat protein
MRVVTTICLSAMTEDPGNAEIGQLLTIINSCRSITVGISSVEGLSRLGLTLSSYGHVSRAVAIFSVASILAPHDPTPRNNLGVTLFQAGLLDGARETFEQAVAQFPDQPQFRLGLGQTLIKLRQWDRAIECLEAALAIDPDLIEAHQSLWLLGEAHNRRDLALEHQAKALERQQLFTEPCRSAQPEATLLLLQAPGDLQANLPTEFFLTPERYTIHRYFLVDGLPLRAQTDLPPYDVIFNAISEPDTTKRSLVSAQEFVDSQTRPCINLPNRIAPTARDHLPTLLDGMANCAVIRTERLSREAVLAAKTNPAGALAELPALIRPIGSHAGHDLERVSSWDEIEAYLSAHDDPGFYISPFFDYRSADGFYRKYRIMFVGGEPLPCHLGVSENWMIHYINAGMHDPDATAKRAEEARFLEEIGSVFDPGLMETLREVARRIGLDYFGIDCGILPDGRLIVFEADSGMVVHLMDDPAMFPYKHEFVPRIFDAAHRMIARLKTS